MICPFYSVLKKNGPGKATFPGPSDLCLLRCFDYVAGPKALVAFHNLELDGIAVLEAPETVAGHVRVVDEHVGAVFSLDETKALLVVEPLDLADAINSLPN